MKVTVVGAGNVGATTAQRLAEKEFVREVVLVDVIEGLPQGKALDIYESAAVEGFDTKVVGSNSYEETAGSNVIIITAGIARKPGMSRDDLMLTNAQIVKSVTEQTVAKSPDAIIIVVSNPVDVMTYLALKVSGFQRNRVMGMAGVLDSSRFRLFIARELNVSVLDVSALVLGNHGDAMVPLVSHATVSGIPLTQLLTKDVLDRLVKRTREGGIEIVNFLKTGSAYYAPSSSVVQMVEAIVKERHRILPASMWLTGEYGMTDACMGVPVKLSRKGAEIIEFKLAPEEEKALHTSAEDVKKNIAKLNL